MSIDKSWITLDHRDKAFWSGLNAFIERCKGHMSSSGLCRCPCEFCENLEWQTLEDIRLHIDENGFSTRYKTWRFHGEPVVLPSLVEHDIPQQTGQLHDLIADVRQENLDHVNTNDDPMNTNDDPMNTTDDANNTTDDPINTNDPINTTDELAELLRLADQDLYPDCKWCSSLDFLAKLSHVKAINKWTDTSFDMLLELLRFAFPKATIPATHYEARKTMKAVGLGYELIDVCKNDCCLFWGPNLKEETCPICSESRWKDKNTKGKKVANKVMRYFPLTPRLKRLYNSRHTAKSMTWHATGRCTDVGKMRHPVDGTTWKDFDARYPDFASERRNVRLGLAADGFNPFGNMSVSYSMWPVILTTYNLPPWMCMKETTFMLTLLIPGPKSPGKDMDVFLRPLIDELKTLWSHGVKTNDAATNTSFTMRAMLLWTINDFPARSSLSGWSGQGYLACPTCSADTPSQHVRGKTAYVGHRKFLPTNHAWRKSLLFDGKIEKKPIPKKKTNAEILKELDNLPSHLPGKHPLFGGKKRKRDSKVELNWSKRSIFYELEYWSSLQMKHNLDVMHIEKNVCESLLNTLLMHKEKSKDTIKARMVLKDWGIRPDLWLLKTSDGKVLKPHPQYSFSIQDRNLFCQFVKGVKLPDGFGSNFKHKVVDNDSKIAGLKSHDHHIMMQRLLPVGARAYLDSTISTPIIELCFFFKQLCARTLMTSDMKKARDKLVKVLCSLEQIFPPSFFDIMIHLVMHLPEEAIQGGPVYMRWMYPFERYMKKLKNYVRNKARPEGSIAEGYVADEALTFCSRYLEGVQTRFNRPDRNEDAPTVACKFYVFNSVCTPISKGVDRQLDRTLQTKIDWFVLNNSSEIDEYKTEFANEMPETNLQTSFPLWFSNKIKRKFVEDETRCSAELLALANGPLNVYSYTACIVNGVRFVVHGRDLQRTTQNSGVSTTDDDGRPYYGVLEEILELCYLGGRKVVLFRCKWFKTDKQGLVTKDNLTSINTRSDWFKEDQYLLATQANQVFYLDDPVKRRGESGKYWKVVQEVHHRKIWDRDINVGDTEVDLLHGSTSSEISLSANLDDLTPTTLSRGEAMELDATRDVEDEDVDVDTDDDVEDDTDDTDNEPESHIDIFDDSD